MLEYQPLCVRDEITVKSIRKKPHHNGIEFWLQKEQKPHQILQVIGRCQVAQDVGCLFEKWLVRAKLVLLDQVSLHSECDPHDCL